MGAGASSSTTKYGPSASQEGTNNCWLLAADGRLFVGDFADKRIEDESDLTAHMQLVHASGVDPAAVIACGDISATGQIDPDSKSLYNWVLCREVMSGLGSAQAGLTLNNAATRAVMADLTALAEESATLPSEAAVRRASLILASKPNLIWKVGSQPAKATAGQRWASGKQRRDFVWMVIKGALFCGPHEADDDGSRTAHMKQCLALGCDPTDVEFAGSVRGGVISPYSLFNSEAFRTALSALDRSGVLDMPGGRAARLQLRERWAMTPCVPEQRRIAATLLAEDCFTETADGMAHLRKLVWKGEGEKTKAPDAFKARIAWHQAALALLPALRGMVCYGMLCYADICFARRSPSARR
jgi:hypothetical protein